MMGRTQRRRAAPRSRPRRRRRRSPSGGKLFDVQNLLNKTGIEFHWPGYDKGKNLKDKWLADRKMIAKIDKLPGRKTLTERIVRRIMKTKLRLGM